VTHLFLILLLLLAVALWLNSLRARELALGISRRTCQKHGVQFLDQTVALRRVTLVWQADGLRQRRTYQFEFSEEGVGRHQGEVIIRGLDLERISLGGYQPVQEMAPNLWES
jgi:hypothetical protein